MPFFQEATGVAADKGIFNDAAGDQTNNYTTNNNGVNGNQYIFNNYLGDIMVDNPLRGIVHNFSGPTRSHLPLEQVHIDVLVVDGNVTLPKSRLFCALNVYNSLCPCDSETNLH
jgi:hypothetical protein